MNLRPVTQLEARRFIADVHRHSRAPRRVICAVGVEADGKLVGVGTLERPKATSLCDGYTVEASRVCTVGTRNACSMLYGALCRAAGALGYRRLVTYTLSTESGASLRAVGFERVAEVEPEDWERRRLAAGGYQADMYDDERYGVALDRVRWERRLAA